MRSIIFLNLLLILFWGCSHNPDIKRSPSGAYCESDFAHSQKECDDLELWDPRNFSDPNSLDETSKFRVIFHSITGRTEQDWIFSLLKNPEKLEKQGRISASLISETKHETFIGWIGFLLEVPKENYIATGSSDLGSSDNDYNGFIRDTKSPYLPKWTIKSPGAILKETVSYNEILLFGHNPKSKTSIKVKGVILDCPVEKMTKLNDLPEQEFTEIISNCAFLKNKSLFIEGGRNLKKAVPLIKKLFKKYPVYMYPL